VRQVLRGGAEWHGEELDRPPLELGPGAGRARPRAHSVFLQAGRTTSSCSAGSPRTTYRPLRVASAPVSLRMRSHAGSSAVRRVERACRSRYGRDTRAPVPRRGPSSRRQRARPPNAPRGARTARRGRRLRRARRASRRPRGSRAGGRDLALPGLGQAQGPLERREVGLGGAHEALVERDRAREVIDPVPKRLPLQRDRCGSAARSRRAEHTRSRLRDSAR
jgi:hypothetical protein